MKRRDSGTAPRPEAKDKTREVDFVAAARLGTGHYVRPGFLWHHWSEMILSDEKKDWQILEIMRNTRRIFSERICRASASKDGDILDRLAIEPMFDFAEFYFSIKAMGLTGPEDVVVLLDLHNKRVAELAEEKPALDKRWLATHRLSRATFSEIDLLRLEEIWRDIPGELEQSALARFLAPFMSEEIAYALVAAAEEAEFVTRRASVCNAVVVSSTGIMEDVMGTCLREMRLAIGRL